MNKLKKAIINCKPSKLFKVIGCFMLAAAIINAIFGNYMTAAWTALCAMLEFMIANVCNNAEYWQSQAFKILSIAEEQDKMIDSSKGLLEKTSKKLAEANKVLTATIIDRDNANAEIARLKLEIEQLRTVKSNGN